MHKESDIEHIIFQNLMINSNQKVKIVKTNNNVFKEEKKNHKKPSLAEHRLELALRSIVSMEAIANTIRVITEASSRAISAGFVAVALEHVGSGRAFN